MKRAIVWFRQDLRLSDNPALAYACQQYEQVILVFIDDTTAESYSRLGAASQVWLHHSLFQLHALLAKKGAKLILRQGEPAAVLQQLARETQASEIVWNRCYDPISVKRDTAVKAVLRSHCKVKSFKATVLYEPHTVAKADGTPYRVFTPFWKCLNALGFQEIPLAAPARIHSFMPMLVNSSKDQSITNLSLKDLGYVPNQAWPEKLLHSGQPGEQQAQRHLQDFLVNTAADYKNNRDFPAQAGTSRLSPSLHFGELSPVQVMHTAHDFLSQEPQASKGVEAFLRQIVWREFSIHLLWHFPQTLNQPLNQRFIDFPWRTGKEAEQALHMWQRGETGFPIVDAGMRELWATGWMHNRVRMITASLLTKNLLIPWQQGEQWFRDTLVDADLANNVMGWQWVAGCGADAAPYFRIFNPILQGEKFDPQGVYIKRWLPELKARPLKILHHPLSQDEYYAYPKAMTDLKQSRQQALDSFAQIKA